MNTFQVAFGLLLLSTSAATSLAEERTRGSLDLLLSTPLSTNSILAGKWLGSFRQVNHILIWPAVTAGFLLVESGRWLSYLMFLGMLLAYGAGITSVGLASATWISRLGRAVAASVSVYVVFSIGWIWLIALLTMGPDPMTIPAIMGSPLFGTFVGTMFVSSVRRAFPSNAEQNVVGGALFWILVHGGAAAILFAATTSTFDRCLGRISETRGRAITWPPKKPFDARELDFDEWPAGEPAELP